MNDFSKAPDSTILAIITIGWLKFYRAIGCNHAVEALHGGFWCSVAKILLKRLSDNNYHH